MENLIPSLSHITFQKPPPSVLWPNSYTVRPPYHFLLISLFTSQLKWPAENIWHHSNLALMCHFMEFVSPQKKSVLLILFKNNIGQFGLISVKSSLLSTDYLTTGNLLIGLYSTSPFSKPVMERCFSARSWSIHSSLEWVSSLSTGYSLPFPVTVLLLSYSLHCSDSRLFETL